MIPVEISKISFFPPNRGYMVLLEELGGERRKLPIMVGPHEAQSIAMAREKVETPRPMTHDLIVSVLEQLEVRVAKVVIKNLVDGTFYAEITVDRGRKAQAVDSRPSDAIAVALRTGSPIFVSDAVMKEASVKQEKEAEGWGEEWHGQEDMRKMLEMKLQRAIDDEEYEEAAGIRDRLRQMKKD